LFAAKSDPQAGVDSQNYHGIHLMKGESRWSFDVVSLPDAEHVDRICDRFERAWQNGEWPSIESYLDEAEGLERKVLLCELVRLEIELRRARGDAPTEREYVARFAKERSLIEDIFAPLHYVRVDRSTEPEESRDPVFAPTVSAGTVAVDPAEPDTFAPQQTAVGRELGGYLILESIGSGGMGVVYRALERETRRLVALKLIKAEWWGDSTQGSQPELQRRFRHEAKILAALEHEHIVPLYGAGHEQGLLYFSMRLIRGKTLAQILKSEGPLTPHQAARYLEAVARALQYAHEKQVLHRDLKPANIMIDEQDRPCLIDLGLARSLEATDFASSTGKVIGTVEYMSPEQAQGRGEVDRRSDVYGLGATLYALLTGRPPFVGDTPVVVLRKVVEEEVVWSRKLEGKVDRELKTICLRCLEKDPGLRPQSAEAVARALRLYLDDRPTGIAPLGLGWRLLKWCRRKPWRTTAAAAMVVALLIATAGLIKQWHDAQTAARLLAHDLLTQPMSELPRCIARARAAAGFIEPLLHQAEATAHDAATKLRTSLVLVRSEPARAQELAAALLESADPQEHHVIRAVLADFRPTVATVFRRVLEDPAEPVERKARAASALIGLASASTTADSAYDALRAAPDPSLRVAMLDWLIQSRVDPAGLIARLASETDVSIRRMLIQALAEAPQDDPAPALSPGDLARFVQQYRDDPDPGLHASLRYLLTRWGALDQVAVVDAELAGRPPGERRWFVTSWGETMAIVGGDQDPLPGSNPAWDRTPFAISLTETTARDYAAFDPAYPQRRAQIELDDPWADDKPADFVSYDMAAAYCNWRTLQDRLPQSECCFIPDPKDHHMTLVLDYRSRKGYRLPTIQEWEIAARAGTSTDRYCGANPAALDAYVWSIHNTRSHAKPIARKRPNDYGLFDAIGNLIEWCYNPHPPHEPSCKCPSPVGALCQNFHYVSIRGGSFSQPAATLRVHPLQISYDSLSSSEFYNFTGFRVARRHDLE